MYSQGFKNESGLRASAYYAHAVVMIQGRVHVVHLHACQRLSPTSRAGLGLTLIVLTPNGCMRAASTNILYG